MLSITKKYYDFKIQKLYNKHIYGKYLSEIYREFYEYMAKLSIQRYW